MKKQRSLPGLGALVLLALLLCSCGAVQPTPTPVPTNTPLPTGTPTPIPTSTSTPTPSPTATPTPSPTPTPGVGVTVIGGHWQITITTVLQQTELSSGIADYTANEGYAFLIIALAFRNLDSAQPTQISTNEMILTNDEGKVWVPGGKCDTMQPVQYCAVSGAIITMTAGVGWTELSFSAVYVIPEQDILGRELQLLFQGISIPFRVGPNGRHKVTLVYASDAMREKLLIVQQRLRALGYYEVDLEPITRRPSEAGRNVVFYGAPSCEKAIDEIQQQTTDVIKWDSVERESYASGYNRIIIIVSDESLVSAP